MNNESDMLQWLRDLIIREHQEDRKLLLSMDAKLDRMDAKLDKILVELTPPRPVKASITLGTPEPQ